jgi:predicted amidohydrolase YtcJ
MKFLCFLLGVCSFGVINATLAADADLILHHGKIATVDGQGSIRQAIAIKGERIVEVGTDTAVLKHKGANTKVIDLDGKLVIPGLIDSHVHPAAAMIEYDHPLPVMETIQDVLNYIQDRTKQLKEGEWISLRQVFITRLREQRYPNLAELDRVAPKHPVNFSTGPDNMLNSLALKLSGIDKKFKVTDGGPGHVELDPKTGEANGLLRGLARFVKMKDPARKASEKDTYDRTLELFKDYNSVGLTMVCDKSATPDYVARYEQMLAKGELPVRMAVSWNIPTLGPIEKIEENIRKVAEHPLFKGGPRLRIIGIKIFLDGGMLTGSAYMRQPWGDSEIYGITDPTYRGVLNVSRERLLPMVRAATEAGLQFTAHSVGDGAVHLLLDVYDEVNRTTSVRKVRGCITHSNFMSREAVEQAARLGVVLDIQPDWLYLDTRTLVNQFGYDRLRYFQPLKTIFEVGGIAGGGSDHMQKIGSLRSINPYNPFLGMWIAITRQARWYEGRLHPEEALSRHQALQFYTKNNAYLLRLDDQVGSLEAGKRADLVVLDTDILTCPEDKIKDTQALQTYLDGKLMFERK